MDSAIRRQTLADLLRRTARRLPAQDRPRCAATCAGPSPSSMRSSTASPPGLPRGASAMAARVAVLARNSHGFAALRFALARLGAVLVPINFMLQGRRGRLHPAARAGADAGHRLAAWRELAQAAAALDTAVRQFVWLPSEEPTRAGAPAWCRSTTWRSPTARRPPRTWRSRATSRRSSTPAAPSRSPKGAMLTHDAVIWQYASCAGRRQHRRRRRDAARAAAVPLRAARRVPRPVRLRGRDQHHHGQADARQPAAADAAAPHHLVLRAADGVDLAAALAAVRRHRPVGAAQGLLRRVDHAGGGAARDGAAAAAGAASGTCTARPRSRRSPPCSAPRTSCASPAPAAARC